MSGPITWLMLCNRVATCVLALELDRDNELSNLAEQFDCMLDLLQQRNAQIQTAAEQLVTNEATPLVKTALD